MAFRHFSGAFSYTVGVNGIAIQHGLHSLLDFIAGQQKRLKKQSRFRESQRWVHRVRFRRAYLYLYAGDSADDPLVFDFSAYTDVTEPEITLYLEEDRLCLASERK
jgi:hypothetical protein